ncbi:hypothetical protein TNIN_275461 [Trichonephila inaurata madagascariensis]|uniref:Uncharacterized protein n=1 Tax=Trichonephila inaurata madagascariensis TaxID=2747483 RepID=A0A8X6Y9B1_9ARAC|nr:hypothetical protein TNIN_275461 [Trichonephila inaurata madagascariensis]
MFVPGYYVCPERLCLSISCRISSNFKPRKANCYKKIPGKVKEGVSEKNFLPSSSKSADNDGHESINEEYRLPLRLSESDGTAVAGKVKEGVSEKKVLPYSSKSADNDSHESIKGKIERILALINECISEKVLPCSSKSADNDGHESINKENRLTLRLSESDTAAISGKIKEGVGKKVLHCSSKSADNDGRESIKGKIESILALIDKYEFTLEEENKIHRNLDSVQGQRQANQPVVSRNT